MIQRTEFVVRAGCSMLGAVSANDVVAQTIQPRRIGMLFGRQGNANWDVYRDQHRHAFARTER